MEKRNRYVYETKRNYIVDVKADTYIFSQRLIFQVDL